ncbi:hypothetical protein [Pseudomarimonas arenosa]|uniref:Uncharacterized protein n=1 Tax=Pseudomarimonas arenosa TaxID=2774145 RepID=A0AAW3ZP92_9GAMM|nr:hypothetical protein [Pseudomarimonas arenosa]MBD8527543.1 hypothetical protein [Pseudomarimonas arenosa]
MENRLAVTLSGARAALFVLLLMLCRATPAACEAVPVPGLIGSEPPGLISGSQRFVSDDGSAVLILGREPGVPAAHFELYVFNPDSGTLTALTQGSPVVEITRPNGFRQTIPVNSAGITADGSTVFQTYQSGVFADVDPGTGQQIPFLLTRSEPSYAIDVATGNRQALPSRVQASAQALGVPFGTTVLDISANGRYLLMFEAFGDGATVPYQTFYYRLDRQTGAILDIGPTLLAAAPDFVERFSTQSMMSGDGRFVAFSGDRGNRLLTPTGGFTSANVARMSGEPYLLDLDAVTLRPAYSFDISRPRNGGSSLGFLRSLGRTGNVIAFDRTGPTVNEPNPLGAAYIAAADAQGNLTVLIPPQPWLRGTFGTAFGHIAEGEDRIYFQSGEDFVGENPQLSNQLFSVEIATGTIRQITNGDDGGRRLVDLGLQGVLSLGSGLSSVSFIGSSLDHRIVLVYEYGLEPASGFVAAVRSGSATRLTSRSSPLASQAGVPPLSAAEIQFGKVYRCSL